jgi:hypothetical protein
LENG